MWSEGEGRCLPGGKRLRDREGGKSRWEIGSLDLGFNSGGGQHQFETWTVVGFRDRKGGDKEK